jgi:dihydropyrimidinase
VSPRGSAFSDVLVEDGLIVSVGEDDLSGADVVDATGCLVLPGAVDVHTHAFGRVREDTRSALLGGTTTALAFVDALPGERPAEAARRTLSEELPESLIDLAFHAVIWEPAAYRRGDLRDVAALGVGSVKLWLAYLELGIMADDDVAFEVLQEAAELGMVALAHCENGRVIDVLTRQLVAQGRLGIDSLATSRPISLEAECVHRFLALAELAGATPYVVHVTGQESLAEVVAARERGMRVYGEVCPHHLLFDESVYGRSDAVRYVMTPPLRRPTDRAALLDALAGNELDTYASDHCHLRLDRDKLPVEGDFTKIPAGLPGIAVRLPLGFALVASSPRLTVERLVEVACEAPARVFGLYPRKGVLAGGSDADVVVWDPAAPSELTIEGIGDGLGWSPYEGIELPGSLRHVLARGDLVVRDGAWLEADHRGEYLSAPVVGRPSAPRSPLRSPKRRR